MKLLSPGTGLFNLCLLLILSSQSFAQSQCDQTQVTLQSQADVDSFPSRFCSTLCSLTISGNDITNLDSLYVLEKVGTLSINFNPILTSIDGLSNLTSIESPCGSGGLNISSNNLLPDINGLSSLTSIEGRMIIASNTMLSDVDGLSHLQALVAEVDLSGGHAIQNNASLENIDGLAGISTISGGMNISGNPALANLEGLASTTGITGYLTVGHNDALTTLNGLRNVTRVGLYLTVEYNSHLTNLTGLKNINHIGQWNASGMSLTISYNDVLTTLDGLQGLDTIPGTASIEGNDALLNLHGLESVTSFALPGGGSSYNSGFRISNNNSLTDLSAIKVESIDYGRTSFLDISSNASLTTIDLPNLKNIGGYFLTSVTITGNPVLKNLDGLDSLQRITGGYDAGFSISNNPTLQDIDGLSSLIKLSAAQGGALMISNNTQLDRFCGLYNLFHSKGIGCGSPECYSTQEVTIEGNERNPDPEEIESEGPCTDDVSQPTNLVFSNVTSEGMKGTFNRAASFTSGYIVLMKSHGAPAPDDVPQDGTNYHVGQVLGSSTIVVSVGSDTTFSVSGLVPATPYYFDVFSWKTTENGNDYLTVNPLEGHQSTIDGSTMTSSITFSDVTSESMTVALNDTTAGNYIALMRAFGSPSPNDVPQNGHQYHVGNTVGSSTIVVNIGDGSAFTVNGLIPGITYYFDIYKFDNGTFVYDMPPSQGMQATSNEDTGARIAAAEEEELRPYPNPFEGSTSIPFKTVQSETAVQVTIYDLVGREVHVLVSGSFGAGRHEASWDGFDKNGRRVNAGVYVYSVRSDSGVVTGRLSVR